MKRTLAFVLVLVLVGDAFGDAAGQFEAIFGAEAKKVAATRIKSDDVAFAVKLLAAAAGAPDSPKFQVLLYEKAYEFSKKSKEGYPHAIVAARRLGLAAPDRKKECEEKMLSIYDLQYRTARGKDRSTAGQDLLTFLVRRGDRQVESGKTAEALVTYRRANLVARSIRSRNAKYVMEKINATVALQHADRKEAALRKVLNDKPDDSRTARQLLTLLLVEKNDPKAAMEFLPNADADEITRTFVPLATKTWEDLPEDTYTDLGAWYEQLARRTTGPTKVKMLARARAYYQTYLTLRGKADASALKATMPLKKLDKQLATAGRIDCGYTPPPKGVTRALAKWTRIRDAIPPREQIAALRKKMAEVNGAGEPKIKKFLIKDDGIVCLWFDDCKNVASIAPLYRMDLDELSLRATNVESLAPLEGMKLTKLNIRTCPKLRSLEGIQDSRITSLSPGASKLIDDLRPLRGLPITSLHIRGLPVKDLKGLEGMPLESLNALDCQKLESIEPLAGAPLRKLNIANCWALKDFKPLRGLPLTELTINRLPPKDFVLLKGMQLEALDIHGCNIKNLGALRGMKLKRLDLGYCKALESIAGIEKFPLEFLSLRLTKFATPQVAAGLKKKIPTLKKVLIK